MKSQDEQWLLKEKYNGEKTEGFFADCKRLALGEPLAYLIGHTPFLDCTIWLDKHPLIPRPETEFWVEKAIEVIKNQSEQPGLFEAGMATAAAKHPQQKDSERGPAESQQQSFRPSHLRILDLCAGSGCIGVAVGHAVPEACIDFCEIDTRLLSTIEKNCRENDVDPFHTNIYHSNLFTKIPEGQKYDFILSNPPYIDPKLDRTEPSVKSYEPHLALYGGKAGTEIIEAIIATAPTYLKSGGQLWIEHEPEQTVFIKNHATEHGFTATTHKDQFGVDRYSILVLE